MAEGGADDGLVWDGQRSWGEYAITSTASPKRTALTTSFDLSRLVDQIDNRRVFVCRNERQSETPPEQAFRSSLPDRPMKRATPSAARRLGDALHLVRVGDTRRPAPRVTARNAQPRRFIAA